LTYRRKPKREYSRRKKGISRSGVAVSTLKTRKWGEIYYPEGTKPLVVEVKSDGHSSQIEGLGYEKPLDIETIKKTLEEKAKRELEKHQKAEITLNFPKTRRKPVKFSVVGEQSITPPVIHHPSWPPAEHLVKEIKEELRKTPRRKTASDLEAMTYISTASGAAPLNEQWYRIYCHLTRNYLKSKGWKKFDGSMKFLDDHKTLSRYDQRELSSLKQWIFKQQQKVLKERRKQATKLRRAT